MNEQKNIKLQVVEDNKIVDLLPETTISQILMPDGTKLIDKLADIVSAINLRLKIEDYNSSTDTVKTEIQQWIDDLKQELMGDTPNSDYDTFTKLAAYINEHTIETHTIADTMNTKASKTETQQWIADLKQEILGDTPVEAFDTFAELATYISEHQEISDALSGAIGTKASKDETQQWIDNLKQEILGNDPSESYNTFTKLASYINTHKGETDALTATVNLKANTETVNGIISRLDQLGTLSTKSEVSMNELDSGLKQRMTLVDSLASATTSMHISDTKPEISGLWFNTTNN